MIKKLNILFNVEDSQKRFIYMPRHMPFGSEIFQFNEDIVFFVTPQHSVIKWWFKFQFSNLVEFG